MRIRVQYIAAAVLLLFPLSASAQQATPIRYNEGPGIKLSDALVFHPGLSIEMRYDSNVLFTNRQLQGAPYLRLIGHLDLATRSPQRRTDASSGQVAPQKVQFRLKGAVGYREYLSGEDAVVNQRAVEVDAGMLFRWNPSRHFYFQVVDNFARTVTPQNALIVQGAAAPTTSSTIARDQNRMSAGVGIVPGGGRLTFDLGYALNLDAFEADAFSQNNRLFHEINFKGRWRLLPKTAITLDVIQQFYDYYNATATTTRFVGSSPFRVYLGFLGLLTPRLSVVLKVGYGNGIYDEGANFSSILAKAEIGYRFGPLAKVRLGYERSFSDTVFGNFSTDHHVYAGYDHLIATRFILRLSADYYNREYNGDYSGINVNATSITSNLLAIGAGFDWQIKDWVYIGIGYDLQVQALPDDFSSQQRVIGLLDYVRHQVFGKVGIAY
ncbi:MAG: outer membrane beta-barrel protein [Myxococcales bacterium]|nr:outer membrane beta-barrel protein [Myxococcales bacterium]